MRSIGVICFTLFAVAAQGSTLVVPGANKTTLGGQADAAIFGPASWRYQWIFDASMFSAIPTGSLITGIGFRLDANDSSYPKTTLTIPNWDLQLSSSPKTVTTLGTNFAANMGADAVTVYDSSLTIPAKSFTHSGSNYPFYVINFTTPFTYQGTNLLFTLAKDANDQAQDIWVDGIYPVRPTATIGNTLASGNRNAATGTVDFYVFPVTELVYSAPTPEPSSWLLLGSGMLTALALARRSRKPQEACAAL